MIRKYNICFVLVTLMPFALSAQTVFNDGVDLFIRANTDVYLDQISFQNQTNGTDGSITNEGDIYIDEDWTNNAGNNVFVSRNTTGTTHFTGSIDQKIGGTAQTIFEDLTINNTVAVGTSITLNLDVQVGDQLSLTDGVVTTGTNTLIMNSNTAANLTAFSSSSFVLGNLRRTIATNTNTYSFPVGTGTTTGDYYRYDLLNNGLTAGTLTARVDALTEMGSNVDSVIVATEDGTDYTNVLEAAIWTITPAGVGGNYGVRAYITGPADDRFGIVKRATGSTNYADWDSFDASTVIPAGGMPGRTVASGYAEKTGFTSFSEFAVATSVNALPIELLSFEAKLIDKEVQLDWITITEINNDFFTIERGIDAINFAAIKEIDGAGNSNNQLFYTTIDEHPLKGISYYRLKQTDFNGEFSYSNIEPIENRSSGLTFSAYPNPTTSEDIKVFIEGIENNELLRLDILDARGRQVYSKSVITDGNK